MQGETTPPPYITEMDKINDGENIKPGDRAMKKKIPMHFDPEQDRWCVNRDGWDYGLHCGEYVEIYIGGKPVPCSLEWSQDWYVILKDVRFILRTTDKYIVNY